MEQIGYIAFETTSMKTFIIYSVILLFSLGILTILLTPKDEEISDSTKSTTTTSTLSSSSSLAETKLEIQNEDSSNIVIVESKEEVQEMKEEQMDSYQSTAVFIQEEVIEIPIVQEPIVSYTATESDLSSLLESPPPFTTSISTTSVVSVNSITSSTSQTENETESAEPIVMIESPKPASTPKKRMTKQKEVSPPSSPPMSPTRRSDRKAKRPELYDPSGKRR